MFFQIVAPKLLKPRKKSVGFSASIRVFAQPLTPRKGTRGRNNEYFENGSKMFVVVKTFLDFSFPDQKGIFFASAVNLCDPYYDYKFQSYNICQIQPNRPKLPNELPIQLIHRDFVFSCFFTFELNSRLFLTL